MEIKLISIADLTTEGFQTRAGLCPAVVKEYTDILKNGEQLPPVSVVCDNRPDADGSVRPRYYLVDGFHRKDAAIKAGRSMIDASITEGTFTDALRIALKANAAHGLRRTNADKRTALAMAWAHRAELFGTDKPTDTDLAETCGVTRMTVYRWKKCNNVTLSPDGSGDNKENNPNHCPPPPSISTSCDTDRFGAPVPTKLVPAFASDRFKELVRKLREVQEGVTEELENGNIAFCKVSQTTLITLKNALEDLKSEAPFCVCRVCAGQGCRACGNTGIQKKAEYDRNPKEVKA